MKLPDANLFLYEYWLELAVSSQLIAMGIVDPKKQRDKDNLYTPRVESKTIWGRMTDHRYTDPTGGVWFDIGHGKIVLKCVTSRQDTSQDHNRFVGTVRYAMQLCFATPGYVPGDPNPLTISDRMPYHRIGKMIDTGATPSFTPNLMNDVTALGFDFMLQIRQDKFPQT